MVDVTTDLLIERPVAEVAAFAGDPGNAPSWYVNIESVSWLTPPPLRTESRLRFVARFLGRRLVYTYEVVDYSPGERLVMRTADGPFPMETSYAWEAMGADRTRMTLRNRGSPSGFSKLVQPFLGFAMSRANSADLRRLRKLLEEGSTA
jgi:uncharacterized membrane protein